MANHRWTLLFDAPHSTQDLAVLTLRVEAMLRMKKRDEGFSWSLGRGLISSANLIFEWRTGLLLPPFDPCSTKLSRILRIDEPLISIPWITPEKDLLFFTVFALLFLMAPSWVGRRAGFDVPVAIATLFLVGAALKPHTNLALVNVERHIFSLLSHSIIVLSLLLILCAFLWTPFLSRSHVV